MFRVTMPLISATGLPTNLAAANDPIQRILERTRAPWAYSGPEMHVSSAASVAQAKKSPQ